VLDSVMTLGHPQRAYLIVYLPLFIFTGEK
jgi:hypothetical protein